jgi:hypothetical protein
MHIVISEHILPAIIKIKSMRTTVPYMHDVNTHANLLLNSKDVASTAGAVKTETSEQKTCFNYFFLLRKHFIQYYCIHIGIR